MLRGGCGDASNRVEYRLKLELLDADHLLQVADANLIQLLMQVHDLNFGFQVDFVVQAAARRSRSAWRF